MQKELPLCRFRRHKYLYCLILLHTSCLRKAEKKQKFGSLLNMITGLRVLPCIHLVRHGFAVNGTDIRERAQVGGRLGCQLSTAQ